MPISCKNNNYRRLQIPWLRPQLLSLQLQLYSLQLRLSQLQQRFSDFSAETIFYNAPRISRTAAIMIIAFRWHDRAMSSTKRNWSIVVCCCERHQFISGVDWARKGSSYQVYPSAKLVLDFSVGSNITSGILLYPIKMYESTVVFH